MRNVISGSLAAAALATALIVAGASAASARDRDGGNFKNSGSSNFRSSNNIVSGGNIRSSNGGSMNFASSNRMRWSGNNNNSNWRWRDRHHHRGSVAFGLGFGAGYYDAPYYAYGPGYYADDDAIAYCMSRFRTYDPDTGTYIGNDGLPHPCP
jgi:hypothetical protein